VDNILVGTAAWTDKTLIDCGRFYPKDCKSADDAPGAGVNGKSKDVRTRCRRARGAGPG